MKSDCNHGTDLLKFKAEISLKQRLDSSDSKASQLWSDFLEIKKKIIKKIVGFLR